MHTVEEANEGEPGSKSDVRASGGGRPAPPFAPPARKLLQARKKAANMLSRHYKRSRARRDFVPQTDEFELLPAPCADDLESPAAPLEAAPTPPRGPPRKVMSCWAGVCVHTPCLAGAMALVLTAAAVTKRAGPQQQAVLAAIERTRLTGKGDKEVEGTYEGERNAAGEKEGRGAYRSVSGDLYEGEWMAGEKEGRGTYEGERNAAGEKEGRGAYRSVSGDVYEGEWKADEREGRGAYQSARGEVYEAGKKEGRGAYRSVSGEGGMYEGERNAAGEKEGHGAYRSISGEVYEGEWKAGKKEGHGAYRSVSGDKYEGEWKAGEKEGRGTYRFASGDVYEGEWKAGKMEGRGTYRFASSDVYEGEWKAGEKEGLGTYRFASGDVFEGEYKADKKEGRGTYWYAITSEPPGWYAINGKVNVGRYSADAEVGEGARWSADRRTAWQLRGGHPVELISLEEAARIAKEIGLPVPLW